MAIRTRTAAGAAEGDTLRAILGQLEELNRLVAGIAGRLAQQAEGDMDPGRPHDPGDAVPPGVAPESPAPLTPQDKKVRRALKRLPQSRKPNQGRKEKRT